MKAYSELEFKPSLYSADNWIKLDALEVGHSDLDLWG